MGLDQNAEDGARFTRKFFSIPIEDFSRLPVTAGLLV